MAPVKNKTAFNAAQHARNFLAADPNHTEVDTVAVPLGAPRFQLLCDRSNFPAQGGPGMTIEAFISYDNGTTFNERIYKADIPAGNVLDQNNQPLNISGGNVPIYQPENPDRVISINILAHVNINSTVEIDFS